MYGIMKPKSLKRTDKKYNKIMNDPNYIAQRKLEGNRALFMFDADDGRFISTGFHNITQHLTHLLPFSYTTNVTILDGEVYHSNFTDAEICGMINPLRKDPDPNEIMLNYWVFDILMLDGVDVRMEPYSVRLQLLATLSIPTFKLLPVIYGDRVVKEKLIEEELLAGREGIVLKNLQGVYQSDKRPTDNWYKIKFTETFDVIITGFKEGLGKYKNLIGSFTYGLFNNIDQIVIIGNCAGIDDELRKDMTNNQGKWIGQVVEIAGLRQMKGGVVKNPRFKRIRFDKSPYECTTKGDK